MVEQVTQDLCFLRNGKVNNTQKKQAVSAHVYSKLTRKVEILHPT